MFYQLSAPSKIVPITTRKHSKMVYLYIIESKLNLQPYGKRQMWRFPHNFVIRPWVESEYSVLWSSVYVRTSIFREQPVDLALSYVPNSFRVRCFGNFYKLIMIIFIILHDMRLVRRMRYVRLYLLIHVHTTGCNYPIFTTPEGFVRRYC